MATESYQGHEAAASEVLIKFQQARPDNPQAQAQIAADIQQAKTDGDIDVARTFGSAGWLRLHSRSKDVATLVGLLTGAPSVLYVEPNWIVYAAVTPITPNDPDFPLQWGLQNTGQTILNQSGTPGADIGAALAWNISTGSAGIAVGVLDTGIDYNHPDLAANVWSAPWAYPFYIGTTEYTCPAGSHGFDAIFDTCDPIDDYGHGTVVSGIIGAVGNNSLGVTGVNWTTSLISCRFLNSVGQGTISAATDCLQFMEGVKGAFGGKGGQADVRVLNNSWACSYCSSPLQPLLNEVNNAYTADMLFVAAAGNWGYNNDSVYVFPGDFDQPAQGAKNVIAVAATDNQDSLPSWSDFGSGSVQLGAPGVNIYSTVDPDFDSQKLYYDWGGAGTSFATPHVVGTAALSLSVCDGDTEWLMSNLLNNVRQVSSLQGKTVTGGVVNAYNSLQAASTACPGTGSETVEGGEQHKVVWTSRTSYQIIYDSGTVSLTVNGATKTVSYGQGSTAQSVATSLYNQINQDGTYPVRAHLSYDWVSPYLYTYLGLTAKTTGPGTCYTVTTSYTYDTVHFKWTSFGINPAGSTLVGCK
jgi:subtilisin family serine protease